MSFWGFRVRGERGEGQGEREHAFDRLRRENMGHSKSHPHSPLPLASLARSFSLSLVQLTRRVLRHARRGGDEAAHALLAGHAEKENKNRVVCFFFSSAPFLKISERTEKKMREQRVLLLPPAVEERKK